MPRQQKSGFSPNLLAIIHPRMQGQHQPKQTVKYGENFMSHLLRARLQFSNSRTKMQINQAESDIIVVLFSAVCLEFISLQFSPKLLQWTRSCEYELQCIGELKSGKSLASESKFLIAFFRKPFKISNICFTKSPFAKKKCEIFSQRCEKLKTISIDFLCFNNQPCI